MIRIVISKEKKLEELEDYGFVNENKEWVYWNGTRRITVVVRTRKVSWNCITNNELAIIIKMAEDGWFKKINYVPQTHRTHYIGLDDEEYKMIVENRIAKGEIDYYD